MMNQEERRQRIAEGIRVTFSQESPLFRHITFAYPPKGEEFGAASTEVVIDGQKPGVVALEVRSISLNMDQERKLREKGFTAQADDDDPRFTLYRVEVASASIDDLATFVEWVYLEVLDSPTDYDPVIQTIASRGEAKGAQKASGCSKSCMSIITIGFWIILGIILLNLLFRSR